MNDLISRQAAIKMFLDEGMPTAAVYIERMPPAQSSILTNDDIETIRIHLNAYKENLCNQKRWNEAEEYQRIIDRLIICGKDTM